MDHPKTEHSVWFQSVNRTFEIRTVWEWDNFGKCQNPNIRISDVYCMYLNCRMQGEHLWLTVSWTIGWGQVKKIKNVRHVEKDCPTVSDILVTSPSSCQFFMSAISGEQFKMKLTRGKGLPSFSLELIKNSAKLYYFHLNKPFRFEIIHKYNGV